MYTFTDSADFSPLRLQSRLPGVIADLQADSSTLPVNRPENRGEEVPHRSRPLRLLAWRRMGSPESGWVALFSTALKKHQVTASSKY